jgi:hypothetical protein
LGLAYSPNPCYIRVNWLLSTNPLNLACLQDAFYFFIFFLFINIWTHHRRVWQLQPCG